MNLGPPASYKMLAEGTPVYGADGESVGAVQRVLAVEEKDIFDGIVMATGEGDRFVDAEQIGAIGERGVSLNLPADQAHALPEPEANPAVIAADAELTTGDRAKSAFRAAWDRISGNY